MGYRVLVPKKYVLIKVPSSCINQRILVLFPIIHDKMKPRIAGSLRMDGYEPLFYAQGFRNFIL